MPTDSTSSAVKQRSFGQKDRLPPTDVGQLLSCIALIAGTTIGAGILALPAATQQAGVPAATLGLCGTWVYMVASGFLLVEVNANLVGVCDRQAGTGILAMARQTLGRPGAIVTGLTYSFLHYALLVAYLARGGEILQAVGDSAGINVPVWLGSVAFEVGLGGLLLWGSARWIGRVNGLLLVGAIAAFIGLLGVCLPHVLPERLGESHWRAVVQPLPTMLVALVFHNTIPTVAARLEGNLYRIRTVILIGSAIPLVMFVAWNAVILGSVGTDGVTFDPLARLAVLGDSTLVSALVWLFSGLAIATSFIGFVYGLLDFYRDLWPQARTKSLFFLPVLVPPLILAFLIPGVFFAALDYAGIFGITVLFGILPAAMAWQQRRVTGEFAPCPPQLPGGWLGLAGMMAIAGGIVLQQLAARYF